MKRPPTLYRSGTVRRTEHRTGACVDCGQPVHHTRTFVLPAGVIDEHVAAWKAFTPRCAAHQRNHMRALAGVL